MKAGKPTSFRLEKLYLDCLDNEGNCFVIYRAKVQYLFVKINYSCLIYSDSRDITSEKSSLKKRGMSDNSEHLIFSNDILEISGQWKRVDNTLPLFRYSDAKNGELVWNCHHPKTLTDITYNGTDFRGYGYAETLTLTMNLLNLPVEELRWGRFLSESYSVVWMNWKGNHTVNKLYFNGSEYNDPVFEKERIIFGGGDYILTFNDISVLRKGKLSNLFSGMPWMKLFFDTRILNSLENKFKAKSVLRRSHEIIASGWSLYEIVIWKK